MGAAIPVMHYTGMAAARFVPSATIEGSTAHAVDMSEVGIFSIVCVTFMVLGLSIFTSFVDRRFSAQAVQLQSSEHRAQQIMETSFDAFVEMDADGPRDRVEQAGRKDFRLDAQRNAGQAGDRYSSRAGIPRFVPRRNCGDAGTDERLHSDETLRDARDCADTARNSGGSHHFSHPA